MLILEGAQAGLSWIMILRKRAAYRVAITDANNHTRRFSYDVANQLILATDALGRNTAWSYNVQGQVQSRSDGRPGFSLQWSYDELGHLKQTSEAHGGGIQYLTSRAYDGLGRRIRLSDVGGTTYYTYDALGRITNVQTPDLQSVGYGYNARGQRTHLTYPDSSRLDYAYWPDGRLQQVSLDNATLAGYSYDTAGRLEQATLASGATTTYDYDGADRLTDLRTRVNNVDVSRFQYTLDRVGQRTAATETLSELLGGQLFAQTRTITYTYDGLRRLTGAGENPGAIYNYHYDAAGNRTEVRVNGIPTETRFYDAANQVDDWSYDAAGNLLQDDTSTYSYDAFNRLLTATTSGQTRHYEYNGDGVLIGQDSIHYTQDQAAPLSQVLQVTDALTTTRYLYGLNRLVALKGNTGTWYVNDGLGSVRQTLNDDGAPFSKINYDPWGKLESGNVPTFGFAGELQDSTNGLVNLRTRWYDTGSGTFTTYRWRASESNDFLPFSHHPYAYALSNPMLYTDPDGRCARQAEPECFSWAEFEATFSDFPYAYDFTYIEQNWHITPQQAGRAAFAYETFWQDPSAYPMSMQDSQDSVRTQATLFSEYFLGQRLIPYDDTVLIQELGQLQELEESRGYLTDEERCRWMSIVFSLGISMELADRIGISRAVHSSHVGGVAGEGAPVYGGFSKYGRRTYDPELAGGPVRELSTGRVRVTPRGVDAVEKHISRFEATTENAYMIKRLRGIAAGELEATTTDLNYYTHELRESVRYRRLGWAEGQPIDDMAAYDLWNNAHTATLADYGLHEGPGVLYHPEVYPY